MAEIKNMFIKSKMNKDLDDRLIPNGEYRNAVNINVSKSEGPDVGAMENVLGNISIEDFDLPNDQNISIIGKYMDISTDSIFLFLTDYTDTSNDKLSNFSPDRGRHYIYRYNLKSDEYVPLIAPTVDTATNTRFLNFSKTHPIDNVNLIEDLLFWTDNRNQPRKININRENGYYTNEDQISVAKYNPYQPIELFEEVVTSVSIVNSGDDYEACSTSSDGCNVACLPVFGVSGTGLTINITSVQGSGSFPPIGPMTSIELSNPGTGYTDGQILPLAKSGGGAMGTIMVNTELKGTLVNKTDEYYALPETAENSNADYDSEWEGDPDFLQDKFVRFSYRFLFEDGEYSLMAPFTQSCFIPKQFGYFNSFPNSGGDSQTVPWEVNDQKSTYESTIVKFMENLVQQATFVIPVPVVNAFQNLRIKEIEILYKDSQEDSIKVVDTIAGSLIPTSTSTYFVYKSEKPFKVLPANETTRVYDQVPVRALTQEVSGNRVMYGNYVDRQAFPSSIEYRVGVSDKWQPTDIVGNRTFPTNASIEYPNHSVKQNRNYQVGIVLSDRYGRQSPVILSSSSVPFNSTTGFGGDTIFVPYRNDLNVQGPSYDEAVWKWPGYSLKVLFNNVIDLGDVGEWSETNPLGWYSYKVVVKQQEQEYYNVYLPGINNGYPNVRFEGTGIDEVVFTPLINDNINKIPRRLNEVGPNQKLYGSSVILYGRVTNWWEPLSSNPSEFPGEVYTRQYNIPENKYDVAVTIGTEIDLDLNAVIPNPIDNYVTVPDSTPAEGYFPWYDGLTNPLFASINPSVELLDPNALTTDTNTIGVIGGPYYGASNNSFIEDNGEFWTAFQPQLAVYETDPFVSNLDIYWETTTTGLISELNEAIRTEDPTLPFEIEDFNFFLPEDKTLMPVNSGFGGGYWVTDSFYFKNQLGAQITDVINVSNLVVTDITLPTPTTVNFFNLVYDGVNSPNNARIRVDTGAPLVYLENLDIRVFNFSFDVTTTSGVTTTLSVEGGLLNIAPNIDEFNGVANPSSPQSIVMEADQFGPWNILASNGCSDSNLNREELLVEIISQEDSTFTAIDNFEVFPNQLASFNNILTAVLRVNPNNLLEPGNYTVVLRVTDANGVGLSEELTINFIVKPTSVNDGFFGYGNNHFDFSVENQITNTSASNEGKWLPELRGGIMNLGNVFEPGYFGTVPKIQPNTQAQTVYSGQQSNARKIPWWGMAWAMIPEDAKSLYWSRQFDNTNGQADGITTSPPLASKTNDWVVPNENFGGADLGNSKVKVWNNENNKYRTRNWEVGSVRKKPGAFADINADLTKGTVNVCVEFELDVKDWKRTWDDVGEVCGGWILLFATVSLLTKLLNVPELYWVLRTGVTISHRSKQGGSWTNWTTASDINGNVPEDIFNGSYQSAPINAAELAEEYVKSTSKSVKATKINPSSSSPINLFYNAPGAPSADNKNVGSNEDVQGGVVRASFNFAFENEGQYRVFVANMGAFNSYSPTGQLMADGSDVQSGGGGNIDGQPWTYRGSTRSDKPWYGVPGRFKTFRAGNSTFLKNGSTVICKNHSNNNQYAFNDVKMTITAEDLFYRDGAVYDWYAFNLCTDLAPSRVAAEGNAQDGVSGYNPEGPNGIQVFANVGPMRYIKQFYTRTGAPGNYVYEKWLPAGMSPGQEFYIAYSNTPSGSVPAEAETVLDRDTEYSCTYNFNAPTGTNPARLWTAKVDAFGNLKENLPSTLYYENPD